MLLMLIVLAGGGLRFWNLDVKPIWIDEFHTMVFSLGNSFQEIQKGTPIASPMLKGFFSLNEEAGCIDIWETETREDTHPPLFFCLKNAWLDKSGFSIWTLRALPAGLGVLAILCVYLLGLSIGDHKTALMAAALMAFSPFAVYLSQEARHYSLLMVMVAVVLWLLQGILQDARQQRATPWLIWGIWGGINLVGLYTHYFFLVSLIAQIGALVLVIYFSGQSGFTQTKQWQVRMAVTLSIIFLAFFPQFWTMMDQVTRPETHWLNFDPFGWPEVLAPPYYTLAGLLSVFLSPFQLPAWLGGMVSAYILMAAFGLWLIRQAFYGLILRWQKAEQRLGLLFLGFYAVLVILAYWAAAYLLGKNVPAYFRYNVFLLPALLVLAGAVFTAFDKQELSEKGVFRRKWFSVPVVVGLIALVCSILVVNNVVAKKPRFDPNIIEYLVTPAGIPKLIVIRYENWTEVAEGLSYAANLNLGHNGDHDQVFFLLIDPDSGEHGALHRAAQMFAGPFELLWKGALLTDALSENRCTSLPSPSVREDYRFFQCREAKE